MDDIIVRLVPLPPSVKGFTIPDENGDYNIYLNVSLDDAELCQAYDHEVEHIGHGHFYDDVKSVAVKESEMRSPPGANRRA